MQPEKIGYLVVIASSLLVTAGAGLAPEPACQPQRPGPGRRGPDHPTPGPDYRTPDYRTPDYRTPDYRAPDHPEPGRRGPNHPGSYPGPGHPKPDDSGRSYPGQGYPGADRPGQGHPGPGHPLIRALDSDHDGVISATEIDNAATVLAGLDVNGDGQLTLDEIRPPPQAGFPGGARFHPPGPPGPPPGERIMRLDADGNAAVTLDEFIAPAAEFFARIDVNGDGWIDVHEAEVAPLPPPRGFPPPLGLPPRGMREWHPLRPGRGGGHPEPIE